MDGHRTIDRRHRITIPRDTFLQAGFHPGDHVTVRPDGRGRVIIERDDEDHGDGLGESYGDGYVSWINGHNA